MFQRITFNPETLMKERLSYYSHKTSIFVVTIFDTIGNVTYSIFALEMISATSFCVQY